MTCKLLISLVAQAVPPAVLRHRQEVFRIRVLVPIESARACRQTDVENLPANLSNQTIGEGKNGGRQQYDGHAMERVPLFVIALPTWRRRRRGQRSYAVVDGY